MNTSLLEAIKGKDGIYILIFWFASCFLGAILGMKSAIGKYNK
jgi:hypothetical protein